MGGWVDTLGGWVGWVGGLLRTSYESIRSTMRAAWRRETWVGNAPRARREATLSTGCRCIEKEEVDVRV